VLLVRGIGSTTTSANFQLMAGFWVVSNHSQFVDLLLMAAMNRPVRVAWIHYTGGRATRLREMVSAMGAFPS